MTAGQIRFGVQAAPGTNAQQWLDLAAKVEDLGFDALYVADHVGVMSSPFPALAAAAVATSTLRLGTYVLNCGVRDPLAVASDTATLDQLSEGRAILGLGAGHTPGEWTMSGRVYPSARERVGLLVEMIEVVTALLRGDVVTHHGTYLHLDEAVLVEPRPVRAKIPILVGGNGRVLLDYAGRRAEIVGLTGLGRTLADGHQHDTDWSQTAIDERVALVRAAADARRAEERPVLDALVQHVEITDHRRDAAERCAALAPGLTPPDVLGAPYMLIGTVDQLVEEIAEHESRWGITSYVVCAAAVDLVAPIIDRLRH